MDGIYKTTVVPSERKKNSAKLTHCADCKYWLQYRDKKHLGICNQTDFDTLATHYCGYATLKGDNTDESST